MSEGEEEEEDNQAPEKTDQTESKKQFRNRLTSIVKPAGTGGLESAEAAASEDEDSPVKSSDVKRRLSFAEEEDRNIIFEHRADDLGVISLGDLKMDSMGEDKRLLIEMGEEEAQLEIR